MAIRVEVVPATEDLARELAPRVRQDVVNEVKASSGRTPLEALLVGVRISDVARAGLFDGEVGCIWGVAPLRRSALSGRVGSLWMFTSDLVERHRKDFWRRSRAELARLFDGYDLLINAIDARNGMALRWGRRLGFDVGDPVPLGLEGEAFHWFRVRRGAHV